MKLDKKVTDFIVLEEGNIGRKAAVVTGATLASSMLGAVLVQMALAWEHCDVNETHHDGYWHSNWVGGWQHGQHSNHDEHFNC